MNIKRFLILNSIAFSILSTSMATAQPSVAGAGMVSIHQTQHFRPNEGKLLTPAQRSELARIKKNLHEQMMPLIKEKRALSMQIRGKLATPHANWNDISKLVEKRNMINAKMNTLWTQTQFKTFQKLGVLLPARHGHHCGFHQKNISKKS